MSILNAPGVIIKEITTLAPSVVPVRTAIPAFIGYTELSGADDPAVWPEANGLKATRVTSLLDFDEKFGGPYPEFGGSPIKVSVISTEINVIPPIDPEPTFWLYYQLQMFYANGGGPCYIVSVGGFSEVSDNISEQLLNGLRALEKEEEPTLILFPDAVKLIANDSTILTSYYNLYQQALAQCAKLKNRFTIIDFHRGDLDLDLEILHITSFRNDIGTNNLNYGATYYPWLETTLRFSFDESSIEIDYFVLNSISSPLESPISPPSEPLPSEIKLKYDTTDLSLLADIPEQTDEIEKKDYYEARSLYHRDIASYTKVKKTLDSFRIKLPPGGAMAGVYATVDNNRGVHKAPANVSLEAVIRPLVEITDDNQKDLNHPTSGKAINAIRFFQDRGRLVWGTRTLDALSNEWRYINVRRFFIFAEESIKRAIEPFVFEPNDANTWVRVKGMIENFLLLQWKEGALTGNNPKQAFFVQVGLGTTMTAIDILDGKMIIEVGMAVARPAEFIVLKFVHKLQEA